MVHLRYYLWKVFTHRIIVQSLRFAANVERLSWLLVEVLAPQLGKIQVDYFSGPVYAYMRNICRLCLGWQTTDKDSARQLRCSPVSPIIIRRVYRYPDYFSSPTYACMNTICRLCPGWETTAEDSARNLVGSPASHRACSGLLWKLQHAREGSCRSVSTGSTNRSMLRWTYVDLYR